MGGWFAPPGGQNRIARIVEAKDANANERKINEVFAGALAAPGAWLAAALPRIGKKNAAGERYLTRPCRHGGAKRPPRPLPCWRPRRNAWALTPWRICTAPRRRGGRKRRRRCYKRARFWPTPPAWMCAGKLRPGAAFLLTLTPFLLAMCAWRRAAILAQIALSKTAALGAARLFIRFRIFAGREWGQTAKWGRLPVCAPAAFWQARQKSAILWKLKTAPWGGQARPGIWRIWATARVGAGANIGAGVITCNYDGKNKNKTNIGAGAFVGSNAQLVAPVRVGRGAYIAAGATISKNVPPRRLAIARARQVLRPLPKAKGKK